MSRNLLEPDLVEIEALLSKDRLARLYDHTKSLRHAIELHQDTLELGTSLLSLVATIEIALRNAVDQQLTGHFGTADWLRSPPPPFVWRDEERQHLEKALASARRAAYAKLTQSQKHALDVRAFPQGVPTKTSHAKRAKARQTQIVVPNGQIIAATTLYFWKRLFSADYEATLWKPTLKRLFPNKMINRATVAQQLEHVYQTRNRLAHHEPVYGGRFADTISAIQYLTSHLHAKPPGGTPLSRLIDLLVSEIVAKEAALTAKHAFFKGP